MSGAIHRLGAWGDLVGSQWGMKIDESVEDTVILWSQLNCVGFRISNQFRIFDICTINVKPSPHFS